MYPSVFFEKTILFFEIFKNDPANPNFWLFEFIGIVFEGKMRAMFGMIFGAGVLLFIANKSDKGSSVHALFYRRMFWLVLFGLIHAHLILWIGDIFDVSLILLYKSGKIQGLFRRLEAVGHILFGKFKK